ncbi:hypothetical protein LIA77_06010 [Sarocladium implicatum]|nr:hypothetical protein LIA77_06010 [Sarocladium implicatum]
MTRGPIMFSSTADSPPELSINSTAAVSLTFCPMRGGERWLTWIVVLLSDVAIVIQGKYILYDLSGNLGLALHAATGYIDEHVAPCRQSGESQAGNQRGWVGQGSIPMAAGKSQLSKEPAWTIMRLCDRLPIGSITRGGFCEAAMPSLTI